MALEGWQESILDWIGNHHLKAVHLESELFSMELGSFYPFLLPTLLAKSLKSRKFH